MWGYIKQIDDLRKYVKELRRVLRPFIEQAHPFDESSFPHLISEAKRIYDLTADVPDCP